MIETWSYSRLKVFETCEWHAKLAYVDKLPEPDTVNRTAANRGTKIHLTAEEYVRGDLPENIPHELSKFEESFGELRAEYEAGNVSLEGEWGFTNEWEPTGWMEENTWARIKLDACQKIDQTAFRVIDYKTGKSWGNEIKHGEQMQLYAIATLLRNPEANGVISELWYLDEGGPPKRVTYTRDQAVKLMANFDRRAKLMTTAQLFKPKPNRHNCKFCPYGPNNGGSDICEYGVTA